MITDETMAANGWAAWSRDGSGQVCTSHAPFGSAAEWTAYVVEETQRGCRVFYPSGPLKMEQRNA